jgi:hypothetical protein
LISPLTSPNNVVKKILLLRNKRSSSFGKV